MLKISRNTLPYLQWALLAIVVSSIVYHFYIHRYELANLRNVGVPSLFLLGAFIVVFNYLSAIRFSIACQLVGAKMSSLESFALSIVGTMVNFLLPGQAGAFLKAAYLKQLYGVPYSKVPAILLGNIVTTIFIGGLLMLCANFFALFRNTNISPILWLISALAFGSILLFWIHLPVHKLPVHSKRLQELLELLLSAWKSFSENRTKLAYICILQTFLYLVSGACILIAFRSLGITIGITFAVILMAATSLLSLVNLVPGNLGINEAIIAYFSTLFGINFTYGLTAAVIMRASSFLLIVFFTPMCWGFLSQKKGFRALQRLGQ